LVGEGKKGDNTKFDKKGKEGENNSTRRSKKKQEEAILK
jgi:hypothetical protein